MSDPTSPSESLFEQFTRHQSAEASGGGPEIPMIDSLELMAGQDVIHIRHQGSIYQLRATRQGKLILTK